MTNLGEQFTDTEVDEILEEIDVAGNGIIRYEGQWTDSSLLISEDVLLFVLELVKLVIGKWRVPRQSRHLWYKQNPFSTSLPPLFEQRQTHLLIYFDVHQSWKRSVRTFIHWWMETFALIVSNGREGNSRIKPPRQPEQRRSSSVLEDT